MVRGSAPLRNCELRSGVTSSADRLRDLVGDASLSAWEWFGRVAAIRTGSARARRFRRFGEHSAICFPVAALFGEEYIEVGDGTIVGPHCTLSAGVMPGHTLGNIPRLSIGARCLLGKSSGIVTHESIEIGDDVFTGHHVYITDASHGYEDITLPIGRQFGESKPVRVGGGSWLGHGVVVLPGADIGRHVAVGAGSVVTGSLPDFSVAVGSPARVVRRYMEGEGWVRVPHDESQGEAPKGSDP
jgi:acetyltransferase-like isoleucine patch superfamily enzyme